MHRFAIDETTETAARRAEIMTDTEARAYLTQYRRALDDVYYTLETARHERDYERIRSSEYQAARLACFVAALQWRIAQHYPAPAALEPR